MRKELLTTCCRFGIAGLLCSITVMLGACGDDDSSSRTAKPTMAFSALSAPTTDTEKRQVLAAESVVIDEQTYSIGYNTIARAGDEIGAGMQKFGRIIDKDGEPIINADGSEFISNSADFSSLLHIGEKIYMVTHFESRPGAMYLTELEQNLSSGELTPVNTQPIDLSTLGGGWVHCAGSVTPWNSHLGSEEYEPDARAFEAATSMNEWDDYAHPMLRYFGLDPETATIEEARSVFNPYNYGWPLEIIVQEDGNHAGVKHYATGRMALELAYVMPDQKTVYMSDDGTNVGFFMFIADQPGDLSAGTLYAAKWNQTSTENGGAADIEWISLGHAQQKNIEEAINGGITFNDLFETATPDANNSCPGGFTSINTTTGHECLKVRAGMDEIASRLESRRYAAIKGATTEFRKEEGITFDAKNGELYVAMSEVARGMEDNMKYGTSNDTYDKGGYNHVRLPANPCGAVYRCDISKDETIGSDYVVQNMTGIVSGEATDYPADSEYAGNSCDIDGIANPDNLTYIPGQNTLIIGEDTGSGHQNDVIWSYDVITTQLSRIQTTPYGSETTSPYFYPNINGFGYLMSVIQHPYGESDEDKLADPAEANAYVGYVGPFPALGDSVPSQVDNARGRLGLESLSFIPTAAPISEKDKAKVWASPGVSVNGSGYAIGFNTILRSGEQLGGNVFGQLQDINGNNILKEDGSADISNSNDFASLLDHPYGLFMVSHFEDRPGSMYVTKLNQDLTTGQLSPESTHNIDFSSIYGGWVHCAGSVTPWQTHLGSEEYEPDARLVDPNTGIKLTENGEKDTYYHAMDSYFPGVTDSDATDMNPYYYGYPIEVDVVDAAGNTETTKHFAMGRMALELAYVMPDQRTVYMTDDGTNIGLFMFIADVAGDLSSGTLYAAKLTQVSAENGGEFDLSWIDLGHARNDDIEALLLGEDRLTFADIFSAETPVDGTCADGYVSVNHGHQATVGDTYQECLMLKPGMEQAASRLETRRYAAYLGATTELRKEEGVTFDPATETLYLAMSEVRKGMEDNDPVYDLGGNNDIRLPANHCGTVYALNVGGNNEIGSGYVAYDMKGVVSGTPKAYSDLSIYANNSCNINGLANPDNVSFVEGHDTLIIGEDTGSGHQNDAIWAYQTSNGKLTRIQTTPYGSETTSPYVYRNINGYGYIMSVIQHPYGESDQDKLVDPVDEAAYTGYIGPFPALDR